MTYQLIKFLNLVGSFLFYSANVDKFIDTEAFVAVLFVFADGQGWVCPLPQSERA